QLTCDDLVTQPELLELAHGVHRKTARDVPGLGGFVGCQTCPEVIVQFLRGGCWSCRVQMDDRGHAFSPGLVRQTHHDRVVDGRVCGQGLFDLLRVDVLPTADDHVLEASGDRHIPTLV